MGDEFQIIKVAQIFNLGHRLMIRFENEVHFVYYLFTFVCYT